MPSVNAKPEAGLVILVCGALRDPDAFHSNLSAAIEIAGVVTNARIILSTWDVDFTNVSQIAAELDPDGCVIKVVSSRSIDVDFRGNWIRQSILWSKGLTEINPTTLVLKMRTDKTEWAGGLVKSIMNYSQLPTPHGKLFSSRIIIPGGLALEPFFYNDMVFAGIASDLLKLVPMSMQPILEQWTINPEQIFHSAPMLANNNSIVSFFRQNRGLPHGYESEQLKQRNAKILCEPLRLTMARQSLEHLSNYYSFPADLNKSGRSDQELESYIGNDEARLVEVMSTPPPKELSQHLKFNDGAKSLVVTSSSAVQHLLAGLNSLTGATPSRYSG
jgi:hypothetical protein